MEYKIATLYGRKRKLYPKNCLHCAKEFWARKDWLAKQKFCSADCGHAFKTKQNTFKTRCAWCKVEIVKSNSKKNTVKHGFHFCSRKCKELAQSLGGIKEIQPSHYGKHKEGTRYREIAFKNLPNKCNNCGYAKFVEVLVVHHKDRNRTNSSVENLEILCPTCHMEEHFLSKDGFWKSKG